MATRIGGALFLVGVLYAIIVLPLAPPEPEPLAMGGAAVCLLLAVLFGRLLLKRREPVAPEVLLAGAYAAIVLAAGFRYFAGEGAPLPQMLFLASMYSAAVHPAQRVVTLVLAATVAHFTPLLYEGVGGEFAAETLGQLALAWSLSAIICVWSLRIRAQRQEAYEAREQAVELARIDALTGMGNRRALEETLPAACAAARRAGEPLSALVADLDGFKAINDTFGHQAGDVMLRDVARAITATLRIPDPCFRWGGDEFVALLPRADEAQAEEVAGRISSAVALSVRTPDGRPVRISVGRATLLGHEAGEDLLARADGDLFTVKAHRKAVRARTA